VNPLASNSSPSPYQSQLWNVNDFPRLFDRVRRLTNEEAQTVRDSRREPGERPVYFNSGSGEDEEISEQFEAFLILLSSGVKTEAVTWINAVASLMPDRDDWNDVLIETVEQQIANAQTLNDAINTTYEGYESFRTNFRIDGFEDITEIGLMLDDLQVGMGELSGRAREAKHLEVLSAILNERATSEEFGDARLQQLRSWITPLMTY